MPNVYEVDAADLDETNGTIVPKGITTDIDGDDVDEDAFEFPRKYRSHKHEWAVKIVNDADQDVDVTPLITTDDDPGLEEYDSVNGLATTVGQGDPPDNVELFESDIIGNAIAVRLQPAAAATGTVKIVFQSRRMG